MKIVFYPIYCSNPHFETELEAMKTHLLGGDVIYVMICKGELKTCFFNPYHRSVLCYYCQSHIKNGLKIIKHKNLKILNYPDISIDYNKIPENFQNINKLKEFTINNVSVGLASASSLISRLNREHKLDTLKYANEVNVELRNSFFISRIFEKYIFPEIDPDLVYIFNGRISTTAPIVDVCKNYNKNFITHERGGQIGRYWLVKNTIPHDVENVYKEIRGLCENLNGKDLISNGSKFFIDRRNRVEQGWFSFTTQQKLNLLPSSISKGKKNIMIFNSTIEEFAAVKGWEKPLFLFEDEIEALSTILDYFRNDESKMFYLRIHPNLRGYNNSQIRDLLNLASRFANLEIILPESPVDSYSLLDNADLVITFGSTIGIEATFWNKPSIQLGMAFYNDTDSVYIPKSIEQLFDLINSDLPSLEKEGAYKYGVWELYRGEPYKYFTQTGLTSGTFEGKKIKADFLWKVALSLYFRLGLMKNTK